VHDKFSEKAGIYVLSVRLVIFNKQLAAKAHGTGAIVNRETAKSRHFGGKIRNIANLTGAGGDGRQNLVYSILA